MRGRVFMLRIEFNIYRVTCTHMRTCGKGNIHLEIKALGKTVSTLPKFPRWPILFKEQFVFTTEVDAAEGLQGLQHYLQHEVVRIQLVQEVNSMREVMLADLCCSLDDLVFPDSTNMNGDTLLLPMNATDYFMGFPKIELFTRMIIEEKSKSSSVCYLPRKWMESRNMNKVRGWEPGSLEQKQNVQRRFSSPPRNTCGCHNIQQESSDTCNVCCSYSALFKNSEDSILNHRVNYCMEKRKQLKLLLPVSLLIRRSIDFR